MEFNQIQGLMQCNTIDIYDDSIQTENRLSDVYLTRDEFLHQFTQLRAENKIDRLQNLRERQDTYDIVRSVHDRVNAYYARGLLNAEKIENLEHKVEGVNQMFEELDGKIDSLSRECLSSKQQLMEEIQKITEKETMERIKPTQLSPYVSNGSSTITLEMADLCAKAVVVNHDVNIKNTKKSNSDNQKISSNQNNESFCCEICGKEYRLRNSLNSHMRNKHSLSSRGRPIGENNPQVEKGFWCTHCNKKFVHAKTCAKHESICVKKPKPTTTSATMVSSRKVQKPGKIITIDF